MFQAFARAIWLLFKPVYFQEVPKEKKNLKFLIHFYCLHVIMFISVTNQNKSKPAGVARAREILQNLHLKKPFIAKIIIKE